MLGFSAVARKRGVEVGQLENRLLKKEIELLEVIQ